MKAKENPFKPTAGGEPPLLIGRGKVIRDFEKGLDNGVGAPGRIMLVTGARGTGKTVMLTCSETGPKRADGMSSKKRPLPDYANALLMPYEPGEGPLTTSLSDHR